MDDQNPRQAVRIAAWEPGKLLLVFAASKPVKRHEGRREDLQAKASSAWCSLAGWAAKAAPWGVKAASWGVTAHSRLPVLPVGAVGSPHLVYCCLSFAFCVLCVSPLYARLSQCLTGTRCRQSGGGLTGSRDLSCQRILCA